MNMVNNKPNVILISVDALKPEFLLNQEKLDVSLPFITEYFMKNGCIATHGMKSVFPPFTYPCHQSMITGTNPVTHGIANNMLFDPEKKHKGAWNWFATHKVKTLWEAAKQAGYIVGSVAFPTSLGANGDYIAPEFWWDGSKLDSAFIDAVSKPQGLILEMENDIGTYAGGLDLTNHGDEQRYKSALWMLNNKLAPVQSEKPFFLSTYFASFDENAHIYGVYSKEAAHSLEKIDSMIGKLITRAQKVTNGNLVVCVVSDHGTLDNTYNIFPNVLLQQAGLLKIDEKGNVIAWDVYCQRAGGIAEIHIHDRNDRRVKEKLATLLKKLVYDEKSGIASVLTGDEARKRGGFPDADYVIISKKGYEIREDTQGAYLRTDLVQKAQHGYNEDFPEMFASFMIAGPNIISKKIDTLRLIDVAPTLAFLMGALLPDAEGKNVLV